MPKEEGRGWRGEEREEMGAEGGERKEEGKGGTETPLGNGMLFPLTSSALVLKPLGRKGRGKDRARPTRHSGRAWQQRGV